MGGLDNETHQIYRVRSDLDKATENIKALEGTKKNDSNVVIEVGFHCNEAQQHQVDDFLSWANSPGLI